MAEEIIFYLMFVILNAALQQLTGECGYLYFNSLDFLFFR